MILICLNRLMSSFRMECFDLKRGYSENGNMSVQIRYPEATAETIDREGWYHTGDLGTIDEDGNVFINGRSKNMLLGPNGQNIYPEEIEDKLNSMTMVVESIVVQRDNKLVALVHPDMDEAKNMGFSEEDLKNIMEQNRNGLNETIPAYEKISEIEIHAEEFEKTPKKSIKRYLYK